ncbi:hypothetical protein U0070_013154 [Myodes glareolus]|uniref:Uncharacterized protein n=1 Tax=Myodes glareolus TaxID=447135 RepID=A0AAW0HJ78_MYOGA
MTKILGAEPHFWSPALFAPKGHLRRRQPHQWPVSWPNLRFLPCRGALEKATGTPPGDALLDFARFFPDLEPLPFPLGLSDPQPLPPLPLHFWEHSFKHLQAIRLLDACSAYTSSSQGEAPGAHLNSRYQLCD